MWSLWPWVQTMATTRRPATPSTIGRWSWAASITSTSSSSPTSQMLLSTVEVLAVEGEDAARDDPVDCATITALHEDDHGAEHLAALHPVERLLDAVERRWSR